MQERVTKKRTDSSELEEEVLRAKAVLTRSRYPKNDHDANSNVQKQGELTNSMSLAVERVLVSLDEKGKKLDQYSESSENKRKLPADAEESQVSKRHVLRLTPLTRCRFRS